MSIAESPDSGVRKVLVKETMPTEQIEVSAQQWSADEQRLRDEGWVPIEETVTTTTAPTTQTSTTTEAPETAEEESD
jgi:hypothetical protein